MKMPQIFQSVLGKKQEHRDTFLSLYLDSHSIAASFWSVVGGKVPENLGWANTSKIEDDWETRAEAADRVIGELEEKTGITDVTKVILGLPLGFLSPTGEIRKEVRQEIKELMSELELTPVGFVPIYQAIIYKLKHDEGVPPSVILLGINDSTIAVSLYKIGTLSGIREIEKTDDIARSVAESLKSFTDLEVLPARMYLYGSLQGSLDEAKSELLKHSWTTTVNFLHFPKIDVVSDLFIVDAISLAGSSELAGAGKLKTSVHPTEESTTPPAEEKPFEEPEQSEVETENSEELPEETENIEEPVDDVTQEVSDAQEAISEDFAEPESKKNEDANVVMVDAESLGFKKDVDVLEKPEEAPHKPIVIPKVEVGTILDSLKRIVGRFGGQKNPIIPIVIGVILICMLALLYWTLPHAVVTVYEIPKTITTSQTITIDPSATGVDAQTNTVPGRKQEKSVSGGKTIAVTGKKNLGDPARGTVTIYNKSSDGSLSLNKGTVLSSGSLQFTLDADVTVASASANESLTGSTITYSTAKAAVTASVIGAQSNMPASSQFTIKNIDPGVAMARNDGAFTGGSSREVTVVTRDDYDAFVKNMSGDLVLQAQKELSSSVGGTEKLIDGTIATTVTDKTFDKELGQEATQLTGKLTITVSGIAYNDVDIKALLTSLSQDKLSKGYTFDNSNITVTVSKIQIKKDGKIAASAAMNAVTLPTVDLTIIRKMITGKSVQKASEYVHTITGISAMKVIFRLSPTKNNLPINNNNILVKESVTQ
jgi:hypothetical protein